MLIIGCFFITNLKSGDRMKIKVTTTFNDRQNGCVTRPVNEAFECSHERARKLMSSGYAEEIKNEQPKGKLTKLKAVKKHLCN